VLIPGTVGFRGAPAPGPDIVSVRDYYETHNGYYAGQVGARGEYQLGRWSASACGKIGLGSNHEDFYVQGHTLLTDSTGLTLFEPGGLYTQVSNLGHYIRDRLAYSAEVDLRLGFQITQHAEVFLGYTFLYWSDVVRPGEQVNRNIDPRQEPSNLAFDRPPQPAEPFRVFRSTDFWAQGLSAGWSFAFDGQAAGRLQIGERVKFRSWPLMRGESLRSPC